MTPPDDRRADEIFDRALDLAPGERAAYLDEACAGDAELRALVERLLGDAPSADSLLDRGAAGQGPLWEEIGGELSAEEPSREGTLVDRYRILREIGRGGMAEVYLAERADGQFQQQVAIKLIKRGKDTDEIVRRFVQERQIMALTTHPNIARLLDGGATGDGRPYFVMEFVEGEPIDRYCDGRRLSIPERLKLFLALAGAVAYAHRNLVIHRDIKPSNVLVAADGTVKLLDFGIARYLGDEAEATELTRTGTRIMTPAYASPEQASGAPVTTASDVYQLGLLLYRLLTGRFPYRVGDGTPETLQRAILQEQPTRPSTAVVRVGPADASGRSTDPDRVGHDRGSSPAALRRALAGDLDNIVLMALRKEPDRRYPSVAQLADDVQRYLDGHPVSARSDTLGYRAWKFAGRHKLAVSFAAFVLLSLIAFGATMAVQAGRIARERDRASQEAETAKQVTAFLVDLFKVSDPSKARGNEIRAREVLDRGAERLATELADQPAVRATMLDAIGQVYQNLGLYDSAGPLLEEALEIRRAVLGPDDPELGESLRSVAWLRENMGDYDGAEPLYRECLDLHRRLLPDEDPRVASSINNLALLLYRRGDYDAAEPLHREALAMRREHLGDEHADVADSLSNLGLVVHNKGDLEEAEALYREALEIRRKVLGEDHPVFATSLDNLGRVRFDQDDVDGAESLLRQALAIRRRVLGEDHPDVAESLNNLAAMLYRKGDLEGAIPVFRETVALDRRVLGEDHPDYAVSLGNLAFLLDRSGRMEEAEPLLREALAIFQEVHPDGHWLVALAHGNLGGCLTRLGRHAEAERELLAADRLFAATLGEEHARSQANIQRLVELYEAWGRADDAARQRRRLVPEEEQDAGA